MSKVNFITHKDKRILLVDFSNSSAEDNSKTINEATTIISSQPKNSLLILTNVENAHYTPKGIQELKAYTVHNTPYVKKSAVFGMKGMQKIFYNAILKITGRDITVFDNIEKAKDWLAQN